MNIGENIKRIRINNQLTQEEFSDLIGISRHSLLNYEKGNRIPSMEVIMKISKIFNVDISQLSTTEMTGDSYCITNDEYNLIKESGIVSENITTNSSYSIEEFKTFLISNGYPVNNLNNEEINELYKKALHFFDFEFFIKGYVKISDN